MMIFINSPIKFKFILLFIVYQILNLQPRIFESYDKSLEFQSSSSRPDTRSCKISYHQKSYTCERQGSPIIVCKSCSRNNRGYRKKWPSGSIPECKVRLWFHPKKYNSTYYNKYRSQISFEFYIFEKLFRPEIKH